MLNKTRFMWERQQFHLCCFLYLELHSASFLNAEFERTQALLMTSPEWKKEIRKKEISRNWVQNKNIRVVVELEIKHVTSNAVASHSFVQPVVHLQKNFSRWNTTKSMIVQYMTTPTFSCRTCFLSPWREPSESQAWWAIFSSSSKRICRRLLDWLSSAGSSWVAQKRPEQNSDKCKCVKKEKCAEQ